MRVVAMCVMLVALGCGAETEDVPRSTPTDAAPVTPARPTSISVGDAQTCSIAEASVFCGAPGETPRKMEALENVVEVASGHDHVCARRADGAVYCWGENAWGQLGDGSLDAQTSPVRVFGIPPATSIAAGYGKSCASLGDGRVVCWGAQETDSRAILVDARPAVRPVTIANVQGAIGVTLGTYHGCALIADRSVACFGANDFGQLGDGTTTSRNSAARVPELTGVKAVAAGAHHTCALLDSGDVACFGADMAGQLGAPAVAKGSRSTPANVAGIAHASAITAGGDHTCAVIDGFPWCWGANERGQVSPGGPSIVRTPIVPTGIGVVTAISTSTTRTCAIAIDGTIACWGI